MIEYLGIAYAVGKTVYGYYKDGKEYFDDIKDVYEAIKGGYDTVKDIKGHFEVKEGDPKLIEVQWVEKSGFGDALKQAGYTIRFSRPEKIPTRELDGWEVMYEVDKEKKVKRRLVLKDDSTLIGRK